MSNPAEYNVWDLTSSMPFIFIAGNCEKTLLGEARSMRHMLNNLTPRDDMLLKESLNESRNKR